MKNTSYISEATLFLNSLLSQEPIHQQQQQLRHTWWDKEFIDQEEQQSYAQNSVKANAYAYFTYPLKQK